MLTDVPLKSRVGGGRPALTELGAVAYRQRSLGWPNCLTGCALIPKGHWDL